MGRVAELGSLDLVTMHDDKSDLRVSGDAKKFALNVRGPGGVVILVAWMASVVAVVTFADSSGRIAGVGLLAFCIAAYFTELRRQSGKDTPKE